MVLLVDKGGETQNHPHLDFTTYHPETEKGHQNHPEMEEGGSSKEEEEDENNNNNNNNNNNGVVEVYGNDTPPVDDVCPICFDSFTVPCRSNCGHWFCANCILQFWMFRSSIQPCKCPLCCCHIVNLKPETSQLIHREDDTDVLKKVHQYNDLYISGLLSPFRRILAFPLIMGRLFRFVIDPDGLRCIYYIMRLLGLLLALIYERGEFEFMPTGGFGIQRMFDMVASLLIVVFFFTGIVYRWVLRGRARPLATVESWET